MPTTVRTAGIIAVAATACCTAAVAPAGAAQASLRDLVARHLQDPSHYSAGLRAWLHPPQAPGPDARAGGGPRFGSNVDANDPTRDLGGGQSETAIAAQRSPDGRRLVMAAWNDASLFLGPATTRTGSGTGVGLSTDGGRSFTDLIGLPNSNRDQQWSGDPTVTSLGDGRHFVVGSMYWPSASACSDKRPSSATIAVTVATVESGGRRPSVRFTAPIEVDQPGDICSLEGRRPPKNLAVLDKDWVSYDPTSRSLAVSYSRFYLIGGIECSPRGCHTVGHSGNGQIEVVRAHIPTDPVNLRRSSFGPPVVIWPEEPFCRTGTPASEKTRCGAENEGAYVAVAPGGDAYVGWERNIYTNLGGGDPYVYEHAALVAARGSTVTRGGIRSPVILTKGRPGNGRGGVRSLDSTLLAGYSRGFGNDYPRVAIDRKSEHAVFVWNDASRHPLGNIWMRASAFGLKKLGAVRRIDDGADYAMRFLPGVSVRDDGTVCTSWYDRRRFGAMSTKTDYFADCRTGVTADADDVRVTTGPTDWAGTSSLIDPNFGDYTDNATDGTRTYFTWSDGRVGVPQPFVDSR